MDITLLRTKFTETETKGVLGCGNIVFGYTIERPCCVSSKEKEVARVLPAGEYRIELRNNPIAGVPCIKVVGVNISVDASIRCIKPLGPKGRYIALQSYEESTGNPAEIDMEAWTKLLGFLLQHDDVKLIIK